MLLVGRYLSPFVRRVAISMQLLEIPFERKELSTKDHREELETINPLGRVPALVLDDGAVLIDSFTMLDYLDQQVGPQRALIPATGVQRCKVLNALGLLQGILDKTLAINSERTHHTEQERSSAWLARCQQQVENGFSALDNTAQSPWLLGESMTQADITLVCTWDFVGLILPDLLSAARYPQLHAVIERCNQMPEVTSTRFVPG